MSEITVQELRELVKAGPVTIYHQGHTGVVVLAVDDLCYDLVTHGWGLKQRGFTRWLWPGELMFTNYWSVRAYLLKHPRETKVITDLRDHEGDRTYGNISS